MTKFIESNQASLATFGDGSDGALTFDGSTTILGMVPSGSAYTLTRDIFATTLTVNVGVSINTAGYRLLARTSLTNRGTIQNNGAAASGVNGGNSGSIGTIAGGLSGATGVVTAAVGAAGSNAGASLGGAGGGGGASGANAGGAGGAITTGNAYQLHALPLGLFGRMASGAVVFGGAGGGAGAGDGTHNPGGGGGGGGVVTLGAPTVDNSSTGLIQALGGVGANAVANSGGGGGGGGGVLVICYSVAYLIGTTSVAGGGGGTNGSGTGVAGAAGSAGTVITLN